MQETPLIAVAPPDPTIACCDHCFRALPPGGGVPCRGSAACRARYCSDACAGAAHAGWHNVVCGHMQELDAHCMSAGSKFARVAAGMLARACAEGDRFDVYWSAVHNLVCTRQPADTDMLPPEWAAGHAAFATAFRGAMSPTDHKLFFSTIFGLRAYATLMGYLRLNSFALQCPLAPAAAGAEAAAVPGAAAALPPPLATPVHRDLPPAPASACSTGSSSDAASGCGTTGSDGSDGCGSSCGSGASAVSERPHDGTALYAVTSFINHSCGASLACAGGGGGVPCARTCVVLPPLMYAPVCRPKPGRGHGPHG